MRVKGEVIIYDMREVEFQEIAHTQKLTRGDAVFLNPPTIASYMYVLPHLMPALKFQVPPFPSAPAMNNDHFLFWRNSFPDCDL